MKKAATSRRTSKAESANPRGAPKKRKKEKKSKGDKKKKPVSLPTEGSDVVNVVEPQLWFESNEPCEGRAYVSNSGPSPLEVSLWAQSGFGVPEPTLLAKFRVQAGHTVNYSASNVIRVEILTEQPNATQRFSYNIEFKQHARREAPEKLKLKTNRKARCYTVIDASNTRDLQTHLLIEDSANERFKTIIDSGVFAYCQPTGVTVEMKSVGKLDSFPRREVTFIAI
jgi:hypothetical protein